MKPHFTFYICRQSWFSNAFPLVSFYVVTVCQPTRAPYLHIYHRLLMLKPTAGHSAAFSTCWNSNHSTI